MKTMRNYLIISAFLAISVVFSSCENIFDEKITETVTTTGTDFAAVLTMTDLIDIDEVIEQSSLKSATVEDDLTMHCFEVTIHENDSATFWPRSWTFTYSDSACTDFFGNVKTGAVNVTLTDWWKNEGSTRSISYENFAINGNQLEGVKTIVNTGLNENNNLTFERSFLNASYTKGDTASMTWECNRNVEMIVGGETFIAADDEYLVEGGASGTDYDGRIFTMTIEEPLHYSKCARFPISGTLMVEIENGSDIYIDYGEGTCDNIAEMTIDDVTTEFTLGEEII